MSDWRKQSEKQTEICTGSGCWQDSDGDSHHMRDCLLHWKSRAEKIEAELARCNARMTMDDEVWVGTLRQSHKENEELRARVAELEKLLTEVLRTEREESPVYDAAGRRLCRWCGDLIAHDRYGNLCLIVRAREVLKGVKP